MNHMWSEIAVFKMTYHQAFELCLVYIILFITFFNVLMIHNITTS